MVKPLARGLAFLSLLLLLTLGGVGLWLKQDVRRLAVAKPWLLEALNPPDAPYKIDFTDVVIDWRQLSRFGKLTVNGMVVTLLDGTVFATMPEVQIAIDPFGFLPHHRALNTIIVQSPQIYMSRTTEGAIRLGLDNVGQSLPLNDLIGFFSGDGNGKQTTNTALPFRAFALENASLTLVDETGGGQFSSRNFTLRLAKQRFNHLSGIINMPFVYNNRPGRAHATLTTSLTGRDRLLNLAMTQFPLELVCQFGACTPEINGSGLISGKARLTLGRDNNPKEGTATLRVEAGTLIATKFFPEPLKLSQGNIVARFGDNGNHLTIEQSKLVFEDTTLNIRLQMLMAGDAWRLIMNGTASRLDVKKLYKYWPTVLAGDSREWVTSKLKAGYAARGEVALNITSAMYDENKFPAAAVKATVDARDITTEYLPGFPELKHVNGIAKFIGDTLRVDATSGSMLSGAKVTSATLTAADLHAPGAPMVANVNLTAPASEVATFLALDHFVFDDAWKLNPAALKGSMEASIKLGFDSFSDDPASTGINFDKVTYDLTAKLKDVGQPKLFGERDISGLSGTLHVANDALKFEGELGVSPTTGLNFVLTQDAQGHTSADISGAIPRSDFSVLGIPDRKQFGEGALGVDAHVELGKETIRIARAALDLTDLAMEIPELSWSKKRGEAGKISLTPREEANSYTLALYARDLKADSASLKLDEAGNLVLLSLPKITSDRNDFALDYKTTPDGFSVNLTGGKLDASASYAQSDNGLLADFPPIALTINLGELVLVPESPLREVKGNLTCNKQRCASANLSAKVGEKGTLTATISKPAGKRQFQLAASNAGDLLRALDVTERVHGGKLDLRGNYDDAKQPPPFRGRLIINDFKLKNSEILGRIIAVASVTGVADALTGDGMSFDKLGADISHKAGVVNITNGRANGAALGITMEGKVDTTTTNLTIKGVLVPANIINSLFTKIPIVGIIAGKEGEGLIAFNYKVDGKYSDPEVSVNPLSGLTPGFLRGIFGGGSSGNSKPTETPDYPGDRPATDKPPVTVKKKPTN